MVDFPSYLNIIHLTIKLYCFIMDATERIEVNPGILAGKPVVKGTRIPVYLVLQMFEEEASIDDVLDAYPDLEKEDVQACIRYATKRVQREELTGSKSVA